MERISIQTQAQRAIPESVRRFVICDALATALQGQPSNSHPAGRARRRVRHRWGLGIHQIMLSKWARARVIAVDTAAEKFEACRRAGADAVVDAALR